MTANEVAIKWYQSDRKLKIQYKNSIGTWTDIETPGFSECFKWRIKPSPITYNLYKKADGNVVAAEKGSMDAEYCSVHYKFITSITPTE